MLIAMAAAGCDEGAQVATTPSPGQGKAALEAGDGKEDPVGEESAAIKVYFANSDATKLVVREKKQGGAQGDKYTAAIELLIAGSGEEGVVSVIPPKTKLRGVKIENGVAYVDFSKEIARDFNGGSAGEIMLVGSIVNTLTEFKEIKAVQILVEGEKIETVSGHMDTSGPFERFKDL